jgi:hypothetical protein
MMKVPAAKILVIDDNPNVVDILVTCLGEDQTDVAVLRTSQSCESVRRSPSEA